MPRLFKNLLHCIWFNLSFIIASDQYWQQSVDYEMNVTLIDSVRQLACSSTIMYKNNSPDELNDIFIHLYPNAFQLGSVKSRDYLNGYGRESRAAYFKDGLDGYESKIHVRNLTIAKNDNFISDNFKIDDTVLRAKLKQPLLPGEKLRIDIDWNHHVGGMVERAGYYEGQYNMAQWYPKVAAYDQKGWHADPFHAEGEFYGEFGNFKVTFELPAKYIIGASGVVTKGDPGWSMVKVDSTVDFQNWFENFEKNYKEPDPLKMRTVQFLAENVHDFAWVASPNFLYEHGRYKDIDVHVLYNRVNAYDWNRVVRERSIRALKWLTEKFGEYSYPQVTNTDRLKSGGMEYPMLIMDGSDSESLILHEIGHIWFYGILGNNELDEAWIDEGFTTAQTRDYMMDRYGATGFDWQSDEWTDKYQRKFWSFNNKLHNDQWSSINYILSGYDEPISRKSYLFKNSTSYRQNAYTKPSLMLNELKYILGDSLYYLSIQDFYKKWELKHVDEQKFIESVEKVSKKELDWFYQEGASNIFPEAWEKFLDPIDKNDRDNLMSAYHKIFIGDDTEKKLAAAIAWSRWEGSTSSLSYNPDMADSFSDPKFALAFALIENHYFVNKGFLEHENQLIESGIDIIRNIPTTIVQGRYDIVCPMTTAWELSKNWPEANLIVAPSSGHTAFEKEITHELIKATEAFAANG